MFAKGLNKTIKYFEETGSFEVKSGRRRKPIVLPPDVAKVLQDGTSSGVKTCRARKIIRFLDMSVRTVLKILCNTQHCYFYKTNHLQ